MGFWKSMGKAVSIIVKPIGKALGIDSGGHHYQDGGEKITVPAPDTSSHSRSVSDGNVLAASYASQYRTLSASQDISKREVDALEQKKQSLLNDNNGIDVQVNATQNQVTKLQQQNAELIRQNTEADRNLQEKLALEQHKMSELAQLKEDLLSANNKKAGVDERLQQIYKVDLQIAEEQRIKEKLNKLKTQFSETVLQEQLKVIDDTDLVEEEENIVGDILIQADI